MPQNTCETRWDGLDYSNNRDHPTWFHKCFAARDSLESQLGFTLDWDERPNKKYCTIGVSHSLNTRSEAERPEAYAWLLSKMHAIESAFRPILKPMDDSPLSEDEPEV